jgi:hypothetical protein
MNKASSIFTTRFIATSPALASLTNKFNIYSTGMNVGGIWIGKPDVWTENFLFILKPREANPGNVLDIKLQFSCTSFLQFILQHF